MRFCHVDSIETGRYGNAAAKSGAVVPAIDTVNQ
jgi:hypothetical protein